MGYQVCTLAASHSQHKEADWLRLNQGIARIVDHAGLDTMMTAPQVVQLDFHGAGGFC